MLWSAFFAFVQRAGYLVGRYYGRPVFLEREPPASVFGTILIAIFLLLNELERAGNPGSPRRQQTWKAVESQGEPSVERSGGSRRWNHASAGGVLERALRHYSFRDVPAMLLFFAMPFPSDDQSSARSFCRTCRQVALDGHGLELIARYSAGACSRLSPSTNSETSEPMVAVTNEYRYSASGSIAWLASQSLLRQFISFALFVVLGRLLNPVDFGTVGLCASIIMIMQSIASYGVASAVVQKPVLNDDEADVAYTINWLIAGAISLFIFLTAALLHTLQFQDNSLPQVLAVLSLSPLLSAVYEIQQARMLRMFRFDISAKKALAAQIVSGIVAVGSAFAGAGVWSLVLQQYTALAIELVIIVLVSPWRPKVEDSSGTSRCICGRSEATSWVPAS